LGLQQSDQLLLCVYENNGGKATAGQNKNESMPSHPIPSVLTVGKFKMFFTYKEFSKQKMTAATTEIKRNQKKKGLDRYQ
jgi:hypothetical protein